MTLCDHLALSHRFGGSFPPLSSPVTVHTYISHLLPRIVSLVVPFLMVYDPKTDSQLKSWLVKNLEPMYDHPLYPLDLCLGS